MTTSTPKLFQPIKVGNLDLTHRVVLAPLTRLRVNAQHVPNEITAEYYSQRASEPGTLLITEATLVAAKAGGYPNVPGLWNNDQIDVWKKVYETWLAGFFKNIYLTTVVLF